MPEELQILAERKFGTGFKPKELSPTDRMFAAGASEPVDWYRNFSVQDELRKKLGNSFIIPVNDQGQTLSCVGQAWAKYAGIKKVMGDPNPNWVEFSPRDVYSHIYLVSGGAYVLDGGLFVRKGILPNEQLPPYWSGKPNMAITEEVMRDKGLEGGRESGDNASPNIYTGLRQLVKGGSVENVYYDIDSIAKAIRDNYGCILAFYGENNGTWLSKFPRVGAVQWGHCVIGVGYMYLNGKKYILILNSWGNNIGEGGWQWMGEEWFGNNGYVGAAFTWSPEVGNILRLADFQRLQKYLEDHDFINQSLGSPALGTQEVWSSIQKMTGLDITYQDWSNYNILTRLK